MSYSPMNNETLPPSTSVDRVTAFAQAVLAGELVAGPDVRNACKRHLHDLATAKERGLEWSLELAQRAIGYFEDVLRLNGGQFEGKPFVGEAGQLLDKMLKFIDLTRDNFYITNMVFWRPPGNRTPNDSEISLCLPLTIKHIKIIKPKLLIFVGSIAAKTLLKSKDGITKLRGREHFYIDEKNSLRIPARAIFHPAYLLRNPIEKKRTWNDLLEIDQFIRKKKILI